jgi:erythromycin esterase
MHIIDARRISTISVTMMLFAGLGVAQQPFLNLDFETSSRSQLWSWAAGASGYEYVPDGSVFFSGAQSLRIRNTGAPASTFGNVYQYFPLDAIRGKHLHLSGYIKTAGMTRGFAGFWLRVDGTSGATLGFNNMSGIGPSGSSDWQQYSFDLDVSTSAVDVVFGALQTGDGTAWFDGVTFTLDGVPFVDGPAPQVGEPTAGQLNWLARAMNPFVSPNPVGDLSDLSPVSRMVGDAHIVGIGEGTHGTSEFFRMKHRMLEYLAANKGFTIFAMEANMPECELVNQYVLTGQGDPAKLLQGLYFWTWNTQEVLDMIQWIRQYNAAGKGPILFTGFDMQYSNVAIPNVEQFVAQAEPAYLTTVQNAYSRAAQVGKNYVNGVSQSASTVNPVVDAVQAVWQHLSQNRAQYLASFSAQDVDWAIQNAVIVQQATYIAIAPSTYRDQAMASNMEWILQQHPGARAMLWAHDGHLWKEPNAMGAYLAANHDADYFVFGQIFHAGNYNAIGSGVLHSWPATTSFPGTVEYVFHSTGMPWFILDLRKASEWKAAASGGSAQLRRRPVDTDSKWLLGPVQYRMIGAIEEDGFLFSSRLTLDFDALIFFDQSTPSHLLPFN